MGNDDLSISKFGELVELKGYKRPTKKEYVRCLRRVADHAGCDPAVLGEDPVRACFLFLRQEKDFSGSAMPIVKAVLHPAHAVSMRSGSRGGFQGSRGLSPSRWWRRAVSLRMVGRDSVEP